MTLEKILRENFGCNHPFLKNPVRKSNYDEYGYQYLTRAGDRAYGRLISLIYALNELCPDCIDTQELIEQMDDIADGIDY